MEYSEEIKYDPNRKKLNLFDELMKVRDEWRGNLKDATPVIRGKDIPLELNQWGLIQWYVHPSIKDTVHRAEIVWVMHIPPKSRTGKLSYQGGHVYYVWKGSKGHTIIDGKTYNWWGKCIINLPIKPSGIVFQHFNDGDDTVKLLGTEPNFVQALGMDRGSKFEVLEPCPEWVEKNKVSPNPRSK
jgi:hypothetical protein